MKGFAKWEQYEIGNIPWVNKAREHPHRRHFVDFVCARGIGSVLEIGGGELIEAQELAEARPDLRYVVADVSETFLRNCRELGVAEPVMASMDGLPFDDRSFDLVYLSSVIEHTPDLQKTLDEMARVAERFYVTMFKWSPQGENLTEQYRPKKEYYSTVFGLRPLLGLFRERGSVDSLTVSTQDGELMSYEDYERSVIGDPDVWRNGDRLNIEGRFDDFA